jgi:hypothetical protein
MDVPPGTFHTTADEPMLPKIVFPDGPKAAAVTPAADSTIFRCGPTCPASQTRNGPLPDAVRNVSPAGLKSTALTESE